MVVSDRANSWLGVPSAGSAGKCWFSLYSEKTLRSVPLSRSTSTEASPPPSDTLDRMVSPASTKGASDMRTTPTYAGVVRALVTLITPGTGWHTLLLDAAEEKTAPTLWVVTNGVVTMVAVVSGVPSTLPTLAPPWVSTQSWSTSVEPSRHRGAPMKKRFFRPCPVGRAAMQKGRQLLPVSVHASRLLADTEAPQRGMSHTVASTSRQLPRVMQSDEGSGACRVGPNWTTRLPESYRVKGQRTDCT